MIVRQKSQQRVTTWCLAAAQPTAVAQLPLATAAAHVLDPNLNPSTSRRHVTMAAATARVRVCKFIQHAG